MANRSPQTLIGLFLVSVFWFFIVLLALTFLFELLYLLKEGGLYKLSVLDALKICGLDWDSDPTDRTSIRHILKQIPLLLAESVITLCLYLASKRRR
jgi:hypothetical protein